MSLLHYAAFPGPNPMQQIEQTAGQLGPLIRYLNVAKRAFSQRLQRRYEERLDSEPCHPAS